MGKIKLKMPPWVASMLDARNSDWLVLEKETQEGTTIGDLLADLASSYTDFRKAIFNPDVGKVNDQVMVILNDNLLPYSEVTEAKLNDGDSIMLVPVYFGG